MKRVVLPELLDRLPADDPAARGSRRDLRRVNGLMRNAGILGEALKATLPATPVAPWQVLEAGTGDGRLSVRVWAHLQSPPPGSRLLLLDRQPLIEDHTLGLLRNQGWSAAGVTAEFEAWLQTPTEKPLDLLYANLFLHHFDNQALARLLTRMADRTHAVVLVEPRRSRVALMAARLLWFVGCNAVTRHDAVRSVHAGFRAHELTALWPDPEGWILSESGAGLFSHRFTARRRITV